MEASETIEMTEDEKKEALHTFLGRLQDFSESINAKKFSGFMTFIFEDGSSLKFMIGDESVEQ